MKQLIKVAEHYIDTTNDEDSLNWIASLLKVYPTNNGYRIESFMSPKFIRITVYKEEK